VTNIDKDAIAAWRKLHSGGPGEWTKNNDRVRCFYADTARVIKYAGWAALCPNDCMFGHAGVKGKNGIVRKPVDHKVHLKFLQDHNVPFSPPILDYTSASQSVHLTNLRSSQLCAAHNPVRITTAPQLRLH